MKYVVCVFALFAAGCGGATPETVPFPGGQIIDLSYSYGENTIYWPTAAGFEKTTDAEGMTEAGFYYSAYTVKTAEHGGTHLDAPIHFSEGRHTADEIPLDRLVGGAVLIDVSEQASADRDYLISTEDIMAWESRNGAIPERAIVLLRTGFGRYWPDAESYLGTAERGADAIASLHFPGLHPDAATWLVGNRNIGALGIDTASIDYGQSSLYESHQILMADNIPAFENLANLGQLPETNFAVVALPMKIEGGSGGPLRIIAVIPD